MSSIQKSNQIVPNVVYNEVDFSVFCEEGVQWNQKSASILSHKKYVT